MKVSLSIMPERPTAPAPIVLTGDLYGSIARAAALGYDAVELHVPHLDRLDVPELRRVLDAAGLPVSGIGPALAFSGGAKFSFASEDEALRQLAWERMRLQIDRCASLGAQVMVGLIHGNLSHDPDLRLRQREWIGAHMRQADGYAAEKGVRLALEAINRYETNFLNRAEEVVAFIEENGLRASGILLDTFHANIEEVSIPGAIRAAGRHLGYIHLPDSNRQRPGAGHLDLPPVIAALREVGYTGYVAMEVLPLPDPETAAVEGLAFTRALLAG